MIELHCGAVLGEKRALLLEGIDRFESLGRAAEAAGIPFAHALELVNAMNEGSNGPLVEILNAEGDDVSVWPTAAGEKAVRDFKELYADLSLSIAEELRLRRSA